VFKTQAQLQLEGAGVGASGFAVAACVGAASFQVGTPNVSVSGEATFTFFRNSLRGALLASFAGVGARVVYQLDVIELTFKITVRLRLFGFQILRFSRDLVDFKSDPIRQVILKTKSTKPGQVDGPPLPPVPDF
jgi:hypothetical protein